MGAYIKGLRKRLAERRGVREIVRGVECQTGEIRCPDDGQTLDLLVLEGDEERATMGLVCPWCGGYFEVECWGEQGKKCVECAENPCVTCEDKVQE